MASRSAIPGFHWKHRTSNTLSALGLLVLLGVGIRFLLHYAVPYFRFDPAYFEDFWPHRMRLILHICGGIPALLCGPFQFWTGLRHKAMGLHRWTGRVYLVGVCVGVTGAFLISIFTTPRSFGVALMSLATAWFMTTAFAYLAIMRRKVQLHKEWMVRSYLVTFAFVTFRLVHDNLPGVASRLGGSPDDTYANLTWLSWVLPLAIFELVLQWRRLFTRGAGVGAAN
jgi:hypothetical protein